MAGFYGALAFLATDASGTIDTITSHMRRTPSLMTTAQKIGVALLVTPIPLLMLDLVAWAAVRALVAPSTSSLQGLAVANVLFGIVGILAVLGVMIGMPAGLILLIVGKKK